MHTTAHRLARPGPLAAATLALTLAGCCGGGGGGSESPAAPVGVVPTAPLAISATNATGVAAGTLGAADLVVAFAGSSIGLTPAGIGAQATAGGAKVDLVGLTQDLLALAASADGTPAGRPLAGGVLTSQADACPAGGSLAFLLDDADDNGSLSAGDSFTASYQDCALDADLTVDGTLTAQIHAFDVVSDPTVIDTSLGFQRLTVSSPTEIVTLAGG